MKNLPSTMTTNATHHQTQPYHNNSVLEGQYREVLNATNCADLQCLRSINSTALNMGSQTALVNAYANNPRLYTFGDYYYGPSVDGEYVRSRHLPISL